MTALVKWRIFETPEGRRFVMGETTDGVSKGPIDLGLFDPRTTRLGDYELVGPPEYSDRVQYELETAWSISRDIRDVTTEACRDLGVDERVFAGYHDGLTPRTDDGRYTIISSLFDTRVEEDIKALERLYAHRIEQPPHWLGIWVLAGWLPIVRELLYRVEHELTTSELDRLRWVQIKEKWGELRAYYHLDGELARLHVDVKTPEGLVHMVRGIDSTLATKIDVFIVDAAEKAARTCEYCGAPGRKVSYRRVAVVCRRHETEVGQ